MANHRIAKPNLSIIALCSQILRSKCQFNISEVLPIGGVTLVGPLPPELQSYIVFAAAIHARSASAAPARALIEAMADPAAREQWKAGGLESVRGGS